MKFRQQKVKSFLRHGTRSNLVEDRGRSSGFTLIEVMIAMAIFSVFMTSFYSGIGDNLLSSSRLSEEIFLSQLCEREINRVVIDPPEFRASLILAAETKTFEDYPDYEYTTKYEKFVIPEMGIGQVSDEGENNAIQGRIFTQVKENMEKLIWQVKIKVRNKKTDASFDLSAWLLNSGANVKFSSI